MSIEKISHKTIALILGGGRGTRLFPLTKARCKPAISIGGQYRLIDIPISNCINSDIKQIYVLTQFLSAGLNRHITRTYRFDVFGARFVEILAAEQSPTNFEYAQGTADAVRQSIRYIENSEADYVLILSGDQLYRMNFNDILSYHIEKKADITLSCIPITENDVERFGVIKINENFQIIDFQEKPKDKKIIKQFHTPHIDINGKHFLASMGIYVFNKSVLLHLLKNLPDTDFGKGIFPKSIKTQKIFSYIFQGYWEDIGTIKSYFDTSMHLLNENPHFSFYDEEMPIYTHPRFLPPSQIKDSHIDQAIISDGSIIQESTIKKSIIGIRSMISSGCTLEETILMGNDNYFSSMTNTKSNNNGNLFGINTDVIIKKVIIDKNVVIGKNSRIIGSKNPDLNFPYHDNSLFYIINGIVIIPRNTMIKENTIIDADEISELRSL